MTTDPDTPHPDRFFVLEDGDVVEIKVKGSRFAGQALAAADEEQAAQRLDAIRKRYHDATHHCWAAWHGAPESARERSDDDGEPSGTAGLPILHPLRASALHDGLVVVTRWFGGTKLGKGGLVQAYGECARRALAAARRREVCWTTTLDVSVGYDDLGTVEALLAREGARIRGVDRNFDADPRFTVRLLRSDADGLKAQLVEATAARARLVDQGVDLEDC